MENLWLSRVGPEWPRLEPGLPQILALFIGEGAQTPNRVVGRINSLEIELWRNQRLTPWLYWELARRGWETYLKSKALSALRHDYVARLKEADQEEKAILLILHRLVAVGITPILLKGADLRVRLYGEAAVRPMADLDLLVSGEQVSLAQATIHKLGFRLQPRSVDPRPGFRLRFRKELHFNPPPGMPLLIDLHWQIDYVDGFYQLPCHYIRQKSVSLKYHGLPVRVLSPEHAFLVMALQALDESHGIMQIIELLLILRLWSIPWPLLLQEATYFNCQAPLYAILLKLNIFFPNLVPPTVIEHLDSYHPTWAEKLILKRNLGYITRHFAVLYRHKSLSDWFTYCGAMLWPEKKYLEAIYDRADRAYYLKQFFLTLFSSKKTWVPD